ncbi:S-adenosyl-L-methionine-dependent methyltransferase [Aspergillus minisclerotigenes]|uniref:S-adenosyl-L-methionine-dependent methyltransferase n=1 Tax=Aspergillus minisclerotigenes TaxID=656917 RepID=A0A5N6IZU2_9EURO|nr:S-adenosyl-L-methionine-dependent methyltransferase [Aspergillus minisclerotigenes]
MVITYEAVAAAPSAPSEFPRLLKEINSQTESLVHALETPSETVMRCCMAQCTAFAPIEACVYLRIFSLIASSDDPKTVRDLANATGADEHMLGRLLKHLAAMGVVTETGPDEPVSLHSAIHALPAWLEKNDYRNPTDARNIAFTMQCNTDLPFLEWLHSDPEHFPLASQFNSIMSTYHQGRPSWIEEGFYPVHDNLIQGARDGEDNVFLVDVGGGRGHDLVEFLSRWPGAPGRLVLQDLPAVLDGIVALDPSIERMAHDFFTEQPVKGARVYSFHIVLHDWNDKDCQAIFSRLAASMERGYSKLLINDVVIPTTGAHWEATALDILMAACFASWERTEQQWHQLIESVGLKVVKVWHGTGSVASVIECELAMVRKAAPLPWPCVCSEMSRCICTLGRNRLSLTEDKYDS